MRKRILTILTVSLLLALALCFLPWPNYISLRITGAEVDSMGNVIAEGDFVLQAKYLQYLFQDHTFTLTHLELPNLEILEPGTWSGPPAVFLSDPSDQRQLVTLYSLVIPHPNGKEGYTDTIIVFLYTDADFSHFLIEYTDSTKQTHYYIGTQQDAPDYAQILAIHEKLEN